jgi:hypothetical protein
MFDEGPLHWVKDSVIGEAVRGDDLRTLMCNRQRQATERATPVEEDGAGSALPMVATLLGSCHAQAVAQSV